MVKVSETAKPANSTESVRLTKTLTEIFKELFELTGNRQHTDEISERITKVVERNYRVSMDAQVISNNIWKAATLTEG